MWIDDLNNGSDSKHSVYDVTKDFVLPVANVAVLVWAILTPNSPGRPLLIAVAVILVVAAFSPRSYTGIKRWMDRLADNRVARRELTQFKDFVRRFGDFVDKSTSDTLHYIIERDVSGPVGAELNKQRGVPTVDFWYQFWYFLLEEDLTRDGSGLANLRFGISQFNNLIGQYNNLCLAPIFGRLPPQLRAQLTPEDKSKLNGFQGRYQAFITDYQQFLRRLAQSRPALERLPCYLPIPNPL